MSPRVAVLPPSRTRPAAAIVRDLVIGPTKPRILICDDLSPEAMDVFSRRGLEAEVRLGLSGDALLDAVRTVDAIVVRSETKITREVIDAAEALRVVGRAGIGVDNIDVEAATERGVVVMNTPLGNATTTAELAITLLLALSRHVVRADRMVRSGKWKKAMLVGSEVTGKTFGVIGLGRIGRLVAERGRGLGMQVIAYDPYLDQGKSPIAGVELTELDALLSRSDYVSVHVSLSAATKHLISRDQLARMKPTARLIQASRGGVVDEIAVVEALEAGRLAGAAFDVFETEPPPADHPLLSRDDVILTPHLGASSTEAQSRVAVDIAEQIGEFIEHGTANNAVNAPALPPGARHELGPFILLAERLGSFVAQRLTSPIRKLELSVGGDIARHGIDHVRLACLVGVLRQSLDQLVNVVNAPSLAAERGIRVLESQSEDAIFRHGEVIVRASNEGGSASVEVVGTVFGREPRIVRIDGVRLDLAAKGHLLITRHRNRPGVLGSIGTVLGDHQVNIRRVELGPLYAGAGVSLGFLTLDGTPDASVLRSIAAIEGIEDVSVLVL